ncbi:F0F1 ATP synthase subunit delta [Xanthomonadaceae bacterium JHOS43]|nr:F0F1 ATP synthase subunit delta [Xanthomonadaceae bacterium JHOS43]MCX7562031.1 F0F1 ATP synthase subunit delta [Xanthomonadaceae bacterium XH05]
MSTALTLARPYARAAVSLAREQQKLPAWSAALGFAAAIAADESVKSLLSSPATGTDAAVALLSPEGDVDAGFTQFLRVLSANGRLPLLPEIAVLFEQARAEAEKVVNVKVTSATALEESEIESLAAALRRRFGSEIALTRAVDPALIGGAVIDAGDVVIDGSVRGKLERLRTALTQ